MGRRRRLVGVEAMGRLTELLRTGCHDGTAPRASGSGKAGECGCGLRRAMQGVLEEIAAEDAGWEGATEGATC